MLIMLKRNIESKKIELWAGGEFQASWGEYAFDRILEDSLGMINSIVKEGVEFGMKTKAAEIRKTLGIS